MNKDLLAKNYLDSCPFELFENWLTAYKKTNVLEPTAMNLATANAEGKPSSRMVLLKAYDKQGFVFYTNLDSRKGNEINSNSFAALNFYFMDLKRQIRIEGQLEAVSSQEADAYYNSRALGSRIGAHASKQSQKLKDVKELKDRIEEFSGKLGSNPPRPKNWSGFRLVPNRIEFWEEGEFRIHNRLEYGRKTASDNWQIGNLYP